jgi:hypothetical protein
LRCYSLAESGAEWVEEAVWSDARAGRGDGGGERKKKTLVFDS